MSSSRDLRRLVNGLSLIAKEILNRSQSLQKARNGDIQSLISSSVKKAVVSATDLAGITKGKVREFSKPVPKETVVYFSDSSKTASSESAPVEKPDLESNVEVLGGETRREAVDLEKTRECNAGNARELDVAMEEVEGKVLGSENLREVDAGIGTKLEDLREDGVGKDRDFEVLEENRGDKVVLPAKRRRPRERRVPSTPFSRALGFAGLGAGLAWGTIQESAKRIVYGTPDSQDKQSALSPFLSEQNAERLALALCRMRGAALKLGQMLSIQDESLVPAPILSALDIVRQGADVMPRSQLNPVLDNELGSDWSSKLECFDYEPLAAASIGQVI
eukprot:TRINITY_DN29403_c0_g2_i3.p1 TRINITY_DN29403_c0_g2~~TRINITY_DN29403_c0_g2_i3.p1  ORF type:complete len:334 (+),score=76.19 TRINITY_DN29403_c0_g2_i3:127-1128(+)